MRSLSSFLQKEPRELTDAELLQAVNYQPKPWRQRLGASMAVIALAAVGAFALQPSKQSEASAYPLPRCSFDPGSQRQQSADYTRWRETQQGPAANGPVSVGIVACDRQVVGDVLVNNRVCLTEAPVTITPKSTDGIQPQSTHSAFATCPSS